MTTTLHVIVASSSMAREASALEDGQHPGRRRHGSFGSHIDRAEMLSTGFEAVGYGRVWSLPAREAPSRRCLRHQNRSVYCYINFPRIKHGSGKRCRCQMPRPGFTPTALAMSLVSIPLLLIICTCLHLIAPQSHSNTIALSPSPTTTGLPATSSSLTPSRLPHSTSAAMPNLTTV